MSNEQKVINFTYDCLLNTNAYKKAMRQATFEIIAYGKSTVDMDRVAEEIVKEMEGKNEHI
jgi:hypothetical protein